MKSPMQSAEENIAKWEKQNKIFISQLVTHIRASVYWDKIQKGWKPDIDAAQWLHVHPFTLWGNEYQMAALRKRIGDNVENIEGGKYTRKVWLDAMHKSSHEVLGECMYQTGEYCDKETGLWEPLLSQPCEIWYPKGVT